MVLGALALACKLAVCATAADDGRGRPDDGRTLALTANSKGSKVAKYLPC